MMRVVTAQSELITLEQELKEVQATKKEDDNGSSSSSDENSDDDINETTPVAKEDDKIQSLRDQISQCQQIIANNGVDPNYVYEGPKVRIYFPDEGNAALARRDWLGNGDSPPKVPPCVEFSACGGVQSQIDVSRDQLIFFFCPKASESEFVEQILERTESTIVDDDNNDGGGGCLQMSIFVNPLLVDMGVTGFGMAGRLLRERLIDPLP